MHSNFCRGEGYNLWESCINVLRKAKERGQKMNSKHGSGLTSLSVINLTTLKRFKISFESK